MSCELVQTFLSVAEKACSEYHMCVEPDMRLCCDAYLGTLSEISNSSRLDPVPVEEGLKNHLPGRIVFVLESPHKDEYADKELKEVWPIQGSSGDNFRTCLHMVIPNVMNGWGIFAVNAIQHQCSQGLNLKKGFNRDAKNYVVGNLLQIKEFRDDLRDRVRPFFGDKGRIPCILLNVCTSYAAYNIGKKNKILVNEILAPIRGIHVFDKITHPSYWCREDPGRMQIWKNQILEWHGELQKQKRKRNN